MNIERRPQDVDAVHDETRTAPFDSYGETFDLNDFLRIVRMRRGLILATAAFVIGITATILFQLTPLYTGTSLVMLDQRKNNVVDVGAVLSGLPTDPSSVENQVQILRSRGLAVRVIDKIRLQQDAEFNPPVDDSALNLTALLNPFRWFGTEPVSTLSEAEEADQQLNEIIERFQDRVSVTTQGRSTAIQIGFQSESPAKAAMIVNAIADAYVEDQLNAKFDATQKATQWLADRVAELAEQQRNAAVAVQQYKAQNNITEAADGTSITEQQLTQLNGQLILARSNLAEQEAKLSSVVELERTGRSADVTSVVGSPLIGQLRQQETELLRKGAELSSRYGPLHPAILDLESEKRDLDAKIQQEIGRVVQTIKNEVSVARARVDSLENSLSGLRGNSSVENRARINLRSLEASAASARSLYEAFLSRFKETEGQEDVQAPDARVISRAAAPAAPSFPNKSLVLGIAVPGGLLLGFMLALLVERLDAGFRTTAQVERFLGLPVLATVPEISGARKPGKAASRILDKPMSAFAESIRGLEMGLVLSNLDDRPKVVLVTSAVAGEGKSTVAISLARLAAQNGKKAVIVESDLRRPTVAKSLGIAGLENGIVEFLAGDAPLEACLVRDPRSDMMCLPVVKKAKNPMVVLSSATMEKLVARLRQEFDVVIIDSAPLLLVHDTKAISHLVDAIVFAVHWEKTPRDASIEALRSLSDIKAPVAGAVLTRANAKRFRYYSYGYQNYSYYNKYYTN